MKGFNSMERCTSCPWYRYTLDNAFCIAVSWASGKHYNILKNMNITVLGNIPGGGGTLQYQMNTGVMLTLPKAGAFGENTISKNEGSLSEKPNFGSKLGSIWWKFYFWSFSEHYRSRNLKKKIVENGKNDQFWDEIETKRSFLWQPNAKKIGGLWVRVIKEPCTCHQNMWGLWVTAETIS